MNRVTRIECRSFLVQERGFTDRIGKKIARIYTCSLMNLILMMPFKVDPVNRLNCSYPSCERRMCYYNKYLIKSTNSFREFTNTLFGENNIGQTFRHFRKISSPLFDKVLVSSMNDQHTPQSWTIMKIIIIIFFLLEFTQRSP